MYCSCPNIIPSGVIMSPAGMTCIIRQQSDNKVNNEILTWTRVLLDGWVLIMIFPTYWSWVDRVQWGLMVIRRVRRIRSTPAWKWTAITWLRSSTGLLKNKEKLTIWQIKLNEKHACTWDAPAPLAATEDDAPGRDELLPPLSSSRFLIQAALGFRFLSGYENNLLET